MNYPYNAPRTYVNPMGNVAASGYYRSSITQQVINEMPPWMHMRDNPRSIGQQFISPVTLELKRIENTLNDSMKSKFIDTARVDEVDVLYRVKLPSNLNLTNVSASGVRCIAAPSGCSPSGVSQIWVQESNMLKEFYYDCLPTRIEIESSGNYISSVDGEEWNSAPSGVLDLEEKYIDIWKKEHEITWCFTNDSPIGHIRKQDSETMEDYEVYNRPGNGIITDLAFYKGILWCLNTDGSQYYLTLASTKTQIPQRPSLDTLAIYNITNGFDVQPSGIIIDNEGTMWISDINKTRTFKANPRYDYFIMDRDNRYIYLKEDYRDSGVFISNT